LIFIKSPASHKTKKASIKGNNLCVRVGRGGDVEEPCRFSATFMFDMCTALVVGSDDVAPCYSIGMLARRQVGKREGSRGAREAASY